MHHDKSKTTDKAADLSETLFLIKTGVELEVVKALDRDTRMDLIRAFGTGINPVEAPDET